jgi:hypothetical protein
MQTLTKHGGPLRASRRIPARSHFMAKLLSDPEFLRFTELQQKQASFTITADEADELRDIVARAQKKRDDRAGAMQSIETFIQQFDISPDD